MPDHIDVPEAAVKSKDRERMADHLQALGLYATANDVRSRRAKLTEGVAHVRDCCLPQVTGWIKERRVMDVESPPTPGTVGASMLARQEARRDELRAFLNDWWPYDLPHIDQKGGGAA